MGVVRAGCPHHPTKGVRFGTFVPSTAHRAVAHDPCAVGLRDAYYANGALAPDRDV